MQNLNATIPPRPASKDPHDQQPDQRFIGLPRIARARVWPQRMVNSALSGRSGSRCSWRRGAVAVCLTTASASACEPTSARRRSSRNDFRRVAPHRRNRSTAVHRARSDRPRSGCARRNHQRMPRFRRCPVDDWRAPEPRVHVPKADPSPREGSAPRDGARFLAPVGHVAKARCTVNRPERENERTAAVGRPDRLHTVRVKQPHVGRDGRAHHSSQHECEQDAGESGGSHGNGITRSGSLRVFQKT